MKTIRVSEEVWQQIAERGRFGETEDDVLRRVFGLSENGGQIPRVEMPRHSEEAIRSSRRRRRNLSTTRMSTSIAGNELVVSFETGAERRWRLPPRHDKQEIRSLRDDAVAFAERQGATIGQQRAVQKALTEAGYWLTK